MNVPSSHTQRAAQRIRVDLNPKSSKGSISDYSRMRIDRIAMKIMKNSRIRFDIDNIYSGRTVTELSMHRDYWAQISLDAYDKAHIDKSEVEDAFLILATLNHVSVDFDRLKSILYSLTHNKPIASAIKNDG